MNRRPETFAWYFLLSFTTFLRTETRQSGDVEDKEWRAAESIKEGVSGGRGSWGRVSNLHVADPTGGSVWPTADSTLILSFRQHPPLASFSPPAMAVFPLAFIVLSLSLLVCAADFYNVLQGQTESGAPGPHTTRSDRLIAWSQ